MAKVCKNCGYTAKDTDQFCFQCGQPLEDTTQQHTEQAEYETQNKNPEGLEKPLSVKDYLIVFFIMLIPIVNFIMLLVWAFDKKNNTNRRNFARAGLIYMIIWYVLGIILTVVLVVCVAMNGERWMRQIQYEVQNEWYDHYYDDDYYYYHHTYEYPYDSNYEYYGSPLSFETIPNTWQEYFEITAVSEI